MAENDTVITGIGQEGRFPDWATEATLKQISNAAGNQGKYYTKMVELLAKSVGGKAESTRALAELKNVINSQRQEQKKETNNNRKSDTEDKVIQNKQLKTMSNLRFLTFMYEELKGTRVDSEKQSEMLAKRLDKVSNAMSSMGASQVQIDQAGGFIEMLDSATEYLKGPMRVVGEAAEIIAKAAVAVHGFNNYMQSQIDDRFNLVNEIRQSGMFAGLDQAGVNLQSFAQQVADNSFSLAEAADMTNKFSRSVGVYGVEESMRFVKSLRDDSNYITRFGMDFGQIINVAGQFLDTQMALGELSSMDDNRRNRSMESFMRSVTVTSNVLKISMEEAADMIKQSLAGPDIASMIATAQFDIPPEMSTAVTALETSMGPIGKILAMKTLDPTRFFQTPEFQELMSNPAMLRMMPQLDEITQRVLSGEDVGSVIQNLGPQLRVAITDPLVSALTAQNQDGMREFISQLLPIIDGTGQAAATTAPSSAVDTQAALNLEVRRQQANLIEQGMTRVIGKYDDLATTISQISSSQASLNQSVMRTFDNIAPAIAFASDLSFDAENIVKDIASATLNTVNSGLDAVSGQDTSGPIAGLTTASSIMNDAALLQSQASTAFKNAVNTLIEGEGWFGDSGLTSGTESQKLQLATALVNIDESGARSLRLEDAVPMPVAEQGEPIDVNSAIRAAQNNAAIFAMNNTLTDEYNSARQAFSNFMLANTNTLSSADAMAEMLDDANLFGNDWNDAAQAAFADVISTMRQEQMISDDRLQQIYEQLAGLSGNRDLNTGWGDGQQQLAEIRDTLSRVAQLQAQSAKTASDTARALGDN